jgi:hypothetical protein
MYLKEYKSIYKWDTCLSIFNVAWCIIIKP